MSELNIYQRMSAITNELGRVAKNLSVGVGKSTYKAVGEADILEAVKPAEEKYGVYSYPISRKVIESATIENEGVDYNTKQVIKKTQLFMRIETVYRFVNMDKPEEFIEMISFADGVDPQDKACGKAMTYSDKYALMKAYKITTGDDPDQHASEDLKKYNSNTLKPETKAEEKARTEAENKLIDSSKVAVIQKELARTGVKEKQILDQYKIFDLKELTVVNWNDAIRKLAKVKNKPEQVNE